MIKGIDHVHLMTRDIDESIDFYTKNLGFYLLRRTRLPDGREVGFIGLNGLLVELFPVGNGVTEVPEAARSPFGLMVDDMAATLADLRAKGILIEDERGAWTFDGLYASFRDPSGVLIELRQWYAGDGPDNHAWQPTHPGVVRTA